MTPKTLVQLALLSWIWGSAFILIRIAGESFPPLWLALIRCATGALTLSIVFALKGSRLPSWPMMRWLTLVGLLNNALPFALFAWGERFVPSNTAAVLNATSPIWTVLLNAFAGNRRVDPRTFGGLACGFFGVVMVIGDQAGWKAVSGAQPSFYIGALAMLIGALCYSIATTVAKAKLSGCEPTSLAFVQLTSASLLLVLPALVTRAPHFPLVPRSVFAVIALGSIGSGIAYLLYYTLIENRTPTELLSVTYLIPAWGLSWGYLAREHVGWSSIAGVLVVLASLALLNTRQRTTPLTIGNARSATGTVIKATQSAP